MPSCGRALFLSGQTLSLLLILPKKKKALNRIIWLIEVNMFFKKKKNSPQLFFPQIWGVLVRNSSATKPENFSQTACLTAAASIKRPKNLKNLWHLNFAPKHIKFGKQIDDYYVFTYKIICSAFFFGKNQVNRGVCM